MRSKRTIAILSVLLAGIGCGKSGTVLGKVPRGEPRTVLAIRDGLTPPNVTLRGKIIEKCPIAGCWFYLGDPTGAIKVDTKTAGFVVTKIPLQAEVTVSGKLVQDGDESVVQATGLCF